MGLKSKLDIGPSEWNQAFVARYMKKGRFEKIGPHNKRRNMDNVRCFGCDELGNYKRDCPKSGNGKRKKEEAHVTYEREEPEYKRSKKDETRYLYYDLDHLPL